MSVTLLLVLKDANKRPAPIKSGVMPNINSPNLLDFCSGVFSYRGVT
nr:MAG TPA: hypothetical protein [Caudoviricetes sp.]